MKSLHSYFIFASLILCFFGCDKQSTCSPSKKPKINQSKPIDLPPDLLPTKGNRVNIQKNEILNNQEVNNAEKNQTKNSNERFLSPDVKSVLDGQKTDVSIEMLRIQSPKEKPLPKILDNDQLSIKTTNKSNKKLIIACFYYTKTQVNGYWKWVKSPVLTLHPNESATIPIQAINDVEIKKNIYGYIGVFKRKEEAEKAIFESLSDDQKIDLDRLLELQETDIEITINQYGFKTDLLDYNLKKFDKKKKLLQPELDFLIENQTEKPILTCCFIYQKSSDQDSFMPWKYHKTSLQRLEPGEIIAIDIATIKELYDWIYMRGFLAIFDIDQEKEARESIYELLKPEQKLNLGRLADILGKKAVISVQKYGSSKKIFNFQPEPFTPFNFSKLQKKRKSRSIF